MNQETMEKLEYRRIKEQLLTYALSWLGRRYVNELAPMTDARRIKGVLDEVEEARRLVESGSSVPIPTMDGLEAGIGRVDKGMSLSEHDLHAVARFLRSVQQLRQYMIKKEDFAPRVTSFARGLEELADLRAELERCVPNGIMADDASDGLGRLRKQMRIVDDRLRKKLDSVVQKYRPYLQDVMLTDRGGRAVLPVKREHRRAVPGAVVDQSASGHTLFVEPADIVPLQEELAELKRLEAFEMAVVCDGLTGLIVADRPALTGNIDLIGHYDFLFAKAKLAKALGGRNVALNDGGRIVIRGGRHPLLTGRNVPLDFDIGDQFRALVITGPNTGGKTVSLKTVGLLTLMVQSGLLVPVDEGSEFAVFSDVLADIGDGQSIDQSLSTFSSHVKNVIRILQHTGPRALVLLDELATGTDPGEGIGLSIAVLEALFEKGATLVATTHFNEIKQFAAATPGFENARMEFDMDTLAPLYRLKIGEAGNSYAFEIALRLGMPPDLIQRARDITRAHQADPLPSSTPPLPARTPGFSPAVRRASGPKPAVHKPNFEVGDRVWIQSLKRSGIVYALPDDRGMMVVLIQKQQRRINARRVSLYLRGDQLYPEQYDLDIVLESKDARKKRQLMRKRHVEGVVIEYAPNQTARNRLDGRQDS